jgi:ribokinase
MAAEQGSPAIVVVGSANIDLAVAVPRHPRPGETVLGWDLATSPGGKGANTAVAAARLGGRGALLGAGRSDSAAATLLASLRDAGVDTSLVKRVDGPSGAALITVDEAGENAIVVSPGANARLSVDHVAEEREAISSCRVLFTVLETPMETVRHAVAVAADTGARVVLNASPPQPLGDAVLAVLDP